MPFFYFVNCRVDFKDIPAYIYTHIIFLLVPLFFSLYNSPTILFTAILSFALLYLLHHIWYEIWYIYNDYFSIKKEDKPTIRIKDDVSDQFIYNQIIFRVILLIVWWIFIFYFLNYYFIFYLLLLIFTWIMYYLHNKLRNRILNYFTWLWLRFSKLIIIIPILSVYVANINDYILPLFLFFSIREMYDIVNNSYRFFIKKYNIEINDKNLIRQKNLIQWVFVLYCMTIGWFHYIITKNLLYFIYIFYFSIFFIVNFRNGLYRLSKYKR